jgi:hypothetical protein
LQGNTIKYRCKLCGRNKFQKPEPHNCVGGFLKHYKRKANKLGIDSVFERIDVIQNDNLKQERDKWQKSVVADIKFAVKTTKTVNITSKVKIK